MIASFAQLLNKRGPVGELGSLTSLYSGAPAREGDDVGHCTDPNCFGHDHGLEGMIAKARRDIKRVGWSVVGILGTPSFAYTVGLTEKRLPELFFEVSGEGTPETLSTVQAVLNSVGSYLVGHPQDARRGVTVTIENGGGPAASYQLETRLRTSQLGMARNMYRSYRVLTVSVVG